MLNPKFKPNLQRNKPIYDYRPLLMTLLLTSSNWLSALPLLAASPAPGIVIDNQATGSFTDPNDNNNEIQIESNVVQVEVAEVAGITISQAALPEEAPSGVSGAGANQGNGDINPDDVIYFTYKITNVGNDPTQFFIPDAPSNITNGTKAGDIQIIEYDPDGASAVDLTSNNITVPNNGATTGTLLNGVTNTNDGSVPVGGSITIRVPVKADSTLTDGQKVTVVMGDTTATDGQNEAYAAGNKDVYTQDNSGTANGDTDGSPIEEREASLSQEVEIAIGATSTDKDYGDAPDSYGTTNSSNGASHGIVSGLHLGTAPDAETDAATPLDGSSDGAEDDGITLLPLTAGSTGYAIPPADITATGTGTLHGWVDFDKNGTFEPDEYTSVAINNGTPDTEGLTWRDISVGSTGNTYARFRFTTDSSINANTPSGAARDGEVEDYSVAIASDPNVLLVKRITKVNGNTTTNNGDDLAAYKDEGTNPYDDNTITVTNPNPPTTPADTENWPDPNIFLIGGINGGKVEPDDEIEYTIYFLSAGDSEAKSVLFCDRVPGNVSFIPTAFNTYPSQATGGLNGSERGILWQYNGNTESLTGVKDGDVAQYFPPGVEPSTIYPKIKCDGINTNGAVVVNLGNLPSATAPGTPNTSYGFVRFRGKVK